MVSVMAKFGKDYMVIFHLVLMVDVVLVHFYHNSFCRVNPQLDKCFGGKKSASSDPSRDNQINK